MKRTLLRYGMVLLVGITFVGGLFWSLPDVTRAAIEPTDPVQMQAPGEGAPSDPAGPAGRQSKRLVRGLIGATAEITGLAAGEVLDGLRAGQSLADIATAQGQSGDAVVQAAVDKVQQRLDRAVAVGRLTQERADQLLDQMTATATDLVNDATLGAQLEQRQTEHLERDTRRNLIRTTADITGLPVSTVAERVRNGESLADIAATEGQSGDAIVQAAVNEYRDVVTRLVDETR